jgi:hypothetical protein
VLTLAETEIPRTGETWTRLGAGKYQETDIVAVAIVAAVQRHLLQLRGASLQLIASAGNQFQPSPPVCSGWLDPSSPRQGRPTHLAHVANRQYTLPVAG